MGIGIFPAGMIIGAMSEAVDATGKTEPRQKSKSTSTKKVAKAAGATGKTKPRQKSKSTSTKKVAKAAGATGKTGPCQKSKSTSTKKVAKAASATGKTELRQKSKSTSTKKVAKAASATGKTELRQKSKGTSTKKVAKAASTTGTTEPRQKSKSTSTKKVVKNTLQEKKKLVEEIILTKEETNYLAKLAKERSANSNSDVINKNDKGGKTMHPKNNNEPAMRLKKVDPLSQETIKKVNAFPLSNALLHDLGLAEEVEKFITEFTKQFDIYLNDNLNLYIELENYPVLLTVTDDYKKYLIDNIPAVGLQKHTSYYSYDDMPDVLKDKRPKCPFKIPRKKDIPQINNSIQNKYGSIYYVLFTNQYVYRHVDDQYDNARYFNSSYRHDCCDIRICELFDDEPYLLFLLKRGFVPRFPAKFKMLSAMFKMLQSLYEDHYVILGSIISLDPAKIGTLRKYLSDKEWLEAFSHYDIELLGKEIQKSTGGTEFISQDTIVNGILTTDSLRADIKEYDSMMLEDPNRGSWELWDAKYRNEALVTLPDVSCYARDPRMDILDGGVIGIDFGTKSTVVVAQDDSDRIEPMRVGMGRFEKAPSAKDYENPTVMEFINIDEFLEAYGTGIGRPLTKWADVTASHTAYNDWQNNDKSEYYFSFFGELKQWAGDSNRRIRIRDKQGKEISLPPYDELQDGDFDPIELYAYFIGLYINNMHTGRIYMEYLLSFPVTYSLETRKRILTSFRKGLARSLPQTVLGDKTSMEKFSVEEGVGEPAAYAVCALQCYNLQPKENENIVYGVFDFGGGTTDFDFGIWRKAKGVKERRYNYVIEHFGDGGDKFLGGENLLELLAYEVFKENQNELRTSEVTFCRPPECNRFPGSEFLLADSQEAQTNMRQLMEKLRPFWERTAEYEKEYSSGVIKLRLFNRNGEVLNNFELKVPVKKLDELLRKRIKKGVDSFFDALISNYKKPSYAEKIKDTTKIHIFLAGNASKSVILQELFRQAMDECAKEIQDRMDKKVKVEDLLLIYPPLGTEDANKQIQKLKVTSIDVNSLESPTGKTGVAIGLVQCRKGSKIRVISETKTEEEIKFRYWVGYSDNDNYFVPVISRDCEYNVWHEYYDAGVDRFEFYYTTSTTAERERGLLASETKKSRQKLPAKAVNEDWLIYLCAVGPDTLEYVVAVNDDAVKSGNFKYGPVKIELD